MASTRQGSSSDRLSRVEEEQIHSGAVTWVGSTPGCRGAPSSNCRLEITASSVKRLMHLSA